MAVTYEPIATTTLGSATANIDFTAISQIYTDIILVVNGAVTSADNTYARVGNGSFDTGSNYSATMLRGNGSTASSARYTNNDKIVNDSSSFPNTTMSNYTLIMQFMNYSNTTTYKTILHRSNNADVGTAATVTLWRSTSAINQIRIYTDPTTWKSGSTFTLYGIKAA